MILKHKVGTRSYVTWQNVYFKDKMSWKIALRVFIVSLMLSKSIVFSLSTSGLYVCNESGENIKVAFATLKTDIWISKGWTSVTNEECQQLTPDFDNPRYYVFAKSENGKNSSGKVWSADHPFCVESEDDFQIPLADHTQACDHKRFFSVWIPNLVEPVFPDHYEVVIGPNNVGLNSPRAER